VEPGGRFWLGKCGDRRADATPHDEGQTQSAIGAQIAGDGFDALCHVMLENQ
jgi:hypothetical protein